MQAWKQKIVSNWYRSHAVYLSILLPLSWLFRGIVRVRRAYLNIFAKQSFNVPVIVVGNITVGGTGKTPLSIALMQYLKQQGFKPGLISRGYGSVYRHFPLEVTEKTEVDFSGDEPKLIAQLTQCPVVIDTMRPRGVRCLIERHDCDVVISDDGLQNYRLARDIEIAVLDGVRAVGNGHCLPAGPLREPVARLSQVDFVVVNGKRLPQFAQLEQYEMALVVQMCRQLSHAETRTLDDFAGKTVHAVAGIGHPQRFFDTLCAHGIDVIPHVFEDHHIYREKDIQFQDGLPILLTEKDAVKCEALPCQNVWVVPVSAVVPEGFLAQVEAKLAECHQRLK